jgi:beta-glucanase (GH16 family)
MRVHSPALTRATGAFLATTLLAGVAALPLTPSASAVAKPGASTVTRDRTIPRGIRAPGDLARSTYPRRAIFTLDTSSHRPWVYAIARNGTVLGTLRLRDAGTLGWRTVTAGRGHQLWVGDIADPAKSRAHVQAYRFREPGNLAGRHPVRWTRFDLRYPDGPHHASTLLVNPVTNRLFVVTKQAGAGAIYAAPAVLSARHPNLLQLVGPAPAQVTGGSFSANGARLILSAQDGVYLYSSMAARPDTANVPDGVAAGNAEFARSGRVLVSGAPTPHLVNSLPLAQMMGVGGSAAPTQWRQAMTEEFSSLDTDLWHVRDKQAYSRDSAYVLARNVSVDGGSLRVQAKQESVGGRAYTSGDLDTYGRYTLPNYFRAEVRAKVPFEQGMWAAPLWIRPSDGSGGEIDLIETYGSEASRPIIHQTIHTDYGVAHQQTHIQKPFDLVGGNALGWHTYVVEKTPGAITMWVDGVQTAQFSKATSPWFDTYYEAGKRWSLRVSLQVGGGQGLPDASTDWSADKTAMVIDYVRTWVPV